MLRNVCCAIVLCVSLFNASARAQDAPPPASASTRTLDAMDDASSWKVVTPEGVRLTVHNDEGVNGACLRLDYEFVTGGGYCIIQKDFAVSLPQNYEFAFHVRGNGPDNNLEFKLLDKQGDSVWWVNRRAYDWPTDWTRLSNKERKLEFAWGPAAGAPLTEISKVEFAIASSSGGKGSVWLDELTLRELPETVPVGQLPAIKITARAGPDVEQDVTYLLASGARIERTPWQPPAGAHEASLVLDLGTVREFGGVTLTHAPVTAPNAFVSAQSSDDGSSWLSLARVRPMRGGVCVLATPEAEARYIRLNWETVPLEHEHPALPVVTGVRVEDASFTSTPNAMMSALASRARRGVYPKYTLNTQSNFTVIGAGGDAEEALMNEEGAVEVAKRGFTIEPFIRERGVSPRLLTWADASTTQSLADGRLPIPTVTRTHDGLELVVTAWADESGKEPVLFVSYTLTNTGKDTRECRLSPVARPFQVNPPWQRLNVEGGVAPIARIEKIEGDSTLAKGVLVSSGRFSRVLALAGPSEAVASSTGVNAIPFNGGDIVSTLDSKSKTWFPDLPVTDPDQLASGTMACDQELWPGRSQRVVIAMPMRDVSQEEAREFTARVYRTDPDASLKATTALWRQRLNRVKLHVPKADAWLADTFSAQLAYILINRDGPALQPGSRSYERSWARDGSLTSAALLACGHAEEARAWIDWFGSHQFENGKVPCVVDSRGPDPVNEHDSHGQYIWAVANYHRHTRDAEFLKTHYPRVQKTVAYIESIRAERRTPEYRDESSPKRAMFGLVPESISHEGYSAKPMHSYWDDFFVLLGLKEAAYIAEQVGDDEWAQAYAKLAAEFRMCLYDSMRRVFAEKGINYIPGCVELGDFDSTSTTIALFPCNEQDHTPQQQLRTTFDRYWAFAQGRMNGGAWEAYTPYEVRHVGAFVRLGQPERAYELLNWFHQHQRPQGWRHWAEVVWNDPATPKFIGDMPHTWVGSDFLNSVLSMVAYDHAGGLVLFAGVPRSWIDSEEKIAVENLHTQYGTLTLSMQRTSGLISARVEGDARVPEAGFTLKKPPRAVGDDITIHSLPAGASWKLE